ncbi:hypothetical protein UFOVP755_81 [uncultured Caudovirales phage]|jgi:hypothetical protein|uniref:Uncharacterized protein n=1 Tax=uncultured Caudovirales phage TaxID=2100421 RepID=A0A6J7X6C5_9CAUD|nr:hypothetical protein UFOVP755_81 [uncultured Caudovirales phage]
MTKQELIDLLNQADKDAIGFDVGAEGDKKINDKNTALAENLIKFMTESLVIDVGGITYPIKVIQ